ncbi:MAG TPA: MEDS domain-containing protein, partial [Vicinamibacterales bacterium]
MPALRILIADDHPAVRRSVRSLVESQDDWTVCAEAADGTEAVEQSERTRPDVVLLDVSMPGLNGFEAAREIRRNRPGARVVMLTMHKSDELDEEAKRAGARAVVDKGDAARTLIRAIEAVRPPEPVPLAGSFLREHRHVAALFASSEERYNVLAPFITEGLVRGEKAIHLIDPPDRDRHVQQLEEHGVGAGAAAARRQLQLIPWEEAYLRGGAFDDTAMTDLLCQLFDEASGNGYPLTRLVAHMEWALLDRPGVHNLVQYEKRLNDFLSRNDNVVICAYDLTHF